MPKSRIVVRNLLPFIKPMNLTIMIRSMKAYIIIIVIIVLSFLDTTQ
jgi:hypothetical protein